MTPAEQLLWGHLRRGQLGGYGFRRQQPMGRFIVDFYSPQAKLAIEVDGQVHCGQVEQDAERSQWLEDAKHCHVIRFTNNEIEHSIDAVLSKIWEALTRPPP
jgi:very-short-patch-repair endonuclease